MASEDAHLLFFQDEEGDQQQANEVDEGLKQLNLVGEEDAVTYELRRAQRQIKVRELRSKGLSFQIWPAAHALCWYLEEIFGQTGMVKTHLSHLPTPENCTFERSMRVLELGAGTGIVGIVCAVLGAHCTITDLPHVTPNLEYNAILNQEAIQSSALGGSVAVKSLRWGERADVEAIGRSFDLIVASDVVYYDHLFEPLLCTLKWLLYSPPCHMAASMDVTPTITPVSVSSYTMLEEGVPTCIPTVKPVPTTTEESSFVGENSIVLEEASSQSSDPNASTFNRKYSTEETNAKMPCTTYTISAPTPVPPSSIATRSMALTGEEDVTPVVLLAHLRRWKKDSHFFRKASKLFHVTVVHKHSHDANTRTGVAIYSLSRKKK